MRSKSKEVTPSAAPMNRGDELKKRTDELICQAEKQKAIFAKPPGNELPLVQVGSSACSRAQNAVVGSYTEFNDDKFFQFPSHISSSLKKKIAKGAFMDLSRLHKYAICERSGHSNLTCFKHDKEYDREKDKPNAK